MDKARWETKAKAAFEDYLQDIKQTLPPDASFRDIERAMLKHSPQMMRDTAAALAASEDFSPKDKEGT